MALALAIAAAPPTFGSPEYLRRMLDAFGNERLVTLNFLNAARRQDGDMFDRYVAANATYSEAGGATGPLRVEALAPLATRCGSLDSHGMRLVEGAVELSIYWNCPGETSSLMTTLSVKNGKVTAAMTGPAVVHVIPDSSVGKAH
jgi:hypothetical protein